MSDTYTTRTLREIIRVVASRFVGMIIIVAVVVGAAAIATFFAPRIYRSEAILMGDPGQRLNPLENQAATLRDRLSLFVTTQRQIITSDYVLATAMLRLDGVTAPADLAANSQAKTQWDQQVQQYVRDHVEDLDAVRKRVEVVTPGGTEAAFSQTMTLRVDWPEEREQARRAGMDAQELAAQRAYEMATHIVDAYMLRYAELESQRTRNTSEFLTSQSLLPAKDALDKANSDLEAFQAKLGADLIIVRNMVGTSVGAETGSARLTTTFRGDLNNISARLAEIQALQSAIGTELAKKDTSQVVAPAAAAPLDSAISELQLRIVAIKLKVNELEPRYTPQYQELVDLRSELAAAQGDLRDELAKELTRLTQEKATLDARYAALSGVVEKDRTSVAELSAKAGRYEQLVAARDAAQTIYQLEQKRVIEAATAAKLAENPVLVTLLEDPTRPDPAHPRRPIVSLNMLLALLGGLVLALVYAFLADHFDHSIKSIDDAEDALDAPVLASVPRLGRRIIRTI